MNYYNYNFWAKCPADGKSIQYELQIKHSEMIMAEDIVAACDFVSPMYQENIADYLAETLPGEIRVIGTHSGVEVEKVRCGR